MKISLNWVKELLTPAAGLDTQAVADTLTAQGLEVEGVERRGRELAGVVVAEVVQVHPHPQAEKLRIVTVRVGEERAEVVCGAANVPPPGGRVCWARPGATLPGGITLGRREVRGIVSPGMLCSERELGFGDQGDGILILSPTVASGTDLATWAGARDDILEVNVTPNRPDALSHVGMARELAAHFGIAVHLPSVLSIPTTDDGPGAAIQIEDPGACPRYQARFLTGLQVGPSPLPMRLRLGFCGMRAVSNLVDVTNYVLLETGHPLHAFDFDRLAPRITVRRAAVGEKIRTLDGVDRDLLPADIVIADERGAVALAGVMGGATSEVCATTTRILLEAATFDPISIRRTARRLSLHSEASYRYERGVDAEGIPYAAARAASLLTALGGGMMAARIVDLFPAPAARRTVALSTARLRRVTGGDYDAAFAMARLDRLGFSCQVTESGLLAQVPTYRPDVAIEEDLIEEVLRMGEYGQGAEPARVAANARSLPNPEGPADQARLLLAASGLHEIVSWGFVPRLLLQTIAGDGADRSLADGVAVKNPISSDYEVMRTSLLPGLAVTLQRNLSRGVASPWLFEVGPVIRKDASGDPVQATHAAGILAGHRPGWLKPGDEADLFDAKRVVSDLLRGLAGHTTAPDFVAPGEVPFLHPGVSARIQMSGRVVGRMGELHPRVARKLGLDVPSFYFEADLAALGDPTPATQVTPPPRFPAVSRDISFWIDAGVPAGDQAAALQAAGEPLLRGVAVLEDFRDSRYVPAGKKGMLWSVTYQAGERTLTDPEVDTAHRRVLASLQERYPVEIR